MKETDAAREEAAQQVAARKSKREQNQRRFQMMNQGQYRSIRNDVAAAIYSGRAGISRDEAATAAEFLIDSGLIDPQVVA